jgi:hypothetical protein
VTLEPCLDDGVPQKGSRVTIRAAIEKTRDWPENDLFAKY